jgi:formiminotetrahydrofolate cyclodeaminase
MNVRINAAGFDDEEFVKASITEGKELEQKANAAEQEILSIVNKKIGI